MMQNGTNMASIAKEQAAVRRKRALLNRAYRAAKRSAQYLYKRRHPGAADAFLQAAKIQDGAAQQGIRIGTIQSSDELDDNALNTYAQKGSNASRIEDWYNNRNSPQSDSGQQTRGFTQAGHTAYDDTYEEDPYGEQFNQNLAVLKRHV